MSTDPFISLESQYSAEIEETVRRHPAVQDCAVVGMPDVRFGERLTVVVQLRAGQSFDPTELVELVKRRLGNGKTPKQIEVWSELPRSQDGTVLKSDIRTSLRTS